MAHWFLNNPYGICIKGCIDGFSRHIIWLEAYSTNKSSWNSKHILWKYAVEFRKEHPKKIIADMGTENGHRKYTKKLRYEDVDEFAQRCFLYNHNQRIQTWWSYLKSHHLQSWISFSINWKKTTNNLAAFFSKFDAALFYAVNIGN